MESDGGIPRQLWTSDRLRFYLTAVLIYAASRIAICAGVAISRRVIPRINNPQVVWQYGPSWVYDLARWDSGWYKIIAEQGYSYTPGTATQQPVAFYPLYPLVARAFGVLGIEPMPALLIIANLAGLACALLLAKLVREQFDDDVALRSVALLSFFPTSVFLSAGYTESLALAFILCFFLMLKRNSLVLAGIAAGAATATRPTGILLLPIIMWAAARREKMLSVRAILRTFAVSALAVSGLAMFALFLWYAFGAPLAFASAQDNWNSGTTAWSRFLAAVLLRPLDLTDIGFWYFAAAIGLPIVAARRLPVGWTVFALGVPLLPYLSLAGGLYGLASMPRFVLLSFPMFVAAATFRVPWSIFAAAVGMLGALLGLNAAMFAAWYWLG